MGCDGGTIPRRDELVRLKKKPEQKDKDAELQYRWRHCALTQQPLQEPIVMCGLGRLYSKQNVIEHLLEREKMPESADHIKGLKDVRDLHLTHNPAFTNCDKNDAGWDVRSAPYICKLIGLEMTGKFRFISLWTCGCVFSERAFKEIKTNACALCQKAYTVDDIVILNGNDVEVLEMRIKMEERRNAKKKANKKEKKAKEIAATVTSEAEAAAAIAGGEAVVEGDMVVKEEPSASGSSNSTETSASSAKDGSKPVGYKLMKNLKREGGVCLSQETEDAKKLKGLYTVAGDPKATDVYKSLFTSHKSEQEQERAHWVTYNPFYN